MKYCCLFLTSLFLIVATSLPAQTGPWAKYDAKMKGEALIRESDGGNINEVVSILEGGGDVNWQLQPSGLTALMAAASGNHLELVKLLIQKGANQNLKDASGRTALDRARQAKAPEVIAVLNVANKNTVPVIPPKKPVLPVIVKANTPTIKTDSITVKKNKPPVTKQSWAPFGSFSAGEKVAFFNGSWHTGTVIEVGAAGDYTHKTALQGERKYLIGREGAPNWNDWISWGSVTGLTREKYWTAFFIGDWRLGETMAVNTKTNGTYQRDEYSFHAATEALQVNLNNTYSWKPMHAKIINGSWKPAADGAGIILLKAYQGLDWTLRNETNATEENIRGLESARLTTNGKMSITAKRPL